MSDANPRITPALRVFTFVEVIVLIGAGFGLFFLPEVARDVWPWSPAPFNTRFLGAIYLTSLIPVAAMWRVGRWAPARGVLPALFAFTAIVLVVSLLNLDQFDLGRWSNLVWWPLYAALPVNTAFHLWLYRKRPPAGATATPASWRVYLRGMSTVLGLYGLGLLLLPATCAAFWPWSIDAFHARMYSAAFVSGALGAYAAARVAAPIEFFTAGLTQTVFGLFSIVGLLLVDATVHRVDWSAAGAWLWLSGFAVALAAGLGMMWRSRHMSPGAP